MTASEQKKQLNNIRLTASTLTKLNSYVPSRRRSAFIRDALDAYLNLPKKNLMDRPRIRGSQVQYVQMPFLITEPQKAKIDVLYSDVSISVVVQNAINEALDKFSWPPPKEHKKDMLTRAPEPLILKLKRIATKPEYGSLRAMNVKLFTQFLKEKPYAANAKDAKSFEWLKATRDRAGQNKPFNILFLEDESKGLSIKIKDESMAVEVNLASFLYTALVWWVDLHESEFSSKPKKAKA